MISRRTASYVGGALLVACLAAANMPGSGAPAPPARVPANARVSPDAVAIDVNSQAARLRDRMAQAPTPDRNPRNPFAFAPAPRPTAAPIVHAAVVEAPAAVIVPPPALTLMGIAEEKVTGGVRRTAVIGGEADALYMVVEGQAVGERYKVTKIGPDAVELEDVVTHGYRRLALR